MRLIHYMYRILPLIIIMHISICFALSEQTTDDLGSIIKETYKYDITNTQMTFVLWVPNEFWGKFLSSLNLYNESQIKEFISVLDPYILIYISDKKSGIGNESDEYTSIEKTRKNTLLIDENGTEYKPIEDELISTNSKSFISRMTQIFNPLKTSTDPHYLLFFPGQNKSGERIADPNKKGVFKIKLYPNEVTWNLPLTSFLSPKICPVDSKKMNPEWEYCPWHGKKLLEHGK